MTGCWVVTEEGLTGTENQCLGVAEALGLTPEIKRIGLRQPWKSLSPWLGFESAAAFTGTPLAPPWPGLVLAAGRKSAAASRYIKKQSGGRAFTVQIQDPRIDPRHFDLVAVPAHDRLRGDNVFVTEATPNRVTPAMLAQAREDFSALLAPLPAPRAAILIGGSSHSYTMTPDLTRKLAEQLAALAGQGFGLMVTASRRTGEANRAILSQALGGTGSLFWDGSGANPYYGFLAWADYILVTADSASMISEAATTGKPVYLIPLEGGSSRFDNLHRNLIRQGVIRPFEGKLEPYAYQPLADAADIAAAIRQLLPA